MTFISFSMILFVLVVFVLYFVLPLRLRWCVLLVSSIAFYSINCIKFLPMIFITSAVVYIAAKYIDKSSDIIQSEDKKDELKLSLIHNRKNVLIISIAFILSILFFFKFHICLFKAIEVIVGGHLLDINLIAPLGISYYTFTAIGYICDIYWKRYKPENNFLHLLLFLIYFPQIMQGPIPRYNALRPQLVNGNSFEYRRVCQGLQLIIWGYFQKLVIADRFAIFVNEVMNNWKSEDGFILIVTMMFYSVQIYMDFSGCMDIARGISEVLGINLEKNFRQPYFSQSVEEYWHRWHITLGKWFKDYLCMPVTVSKYVKEHAKLIRKKYGSRAGKNYILVVSTIVVWIATGLWHGTGWNYLVWGIWNGSIIILSALCKDKYKIIKKYLHINDKSFGWKSFRVIRTFVLAAFIPRVFTRVGSISDALLFIKKMFIRLNFSIFFDKSIYNYGLNKANLVIAMLCILILIGVSMCKEKGMRIRDTIEKLPLILRWTIYYGAVLCIIVIGIYGSGFEKSAFIYMKF